MNSLSYALESVKRQAPLHLGSVLIMSLCFTTILVFSLLSKNIERAFSAWGSQVEMSIYLSEGSGAEQRSRVEATLGKMREIKEFAYVDAKESQAKFVEQFATLIPEIQELEEASPFLASYEIQLNSIPASLFSVRYIEELAAKLQKLDGVEEVSYGKYWFENYLSFLRGLNTSVFLIAVILSLASLLIVGNSIRALVEQKRKEVEILELVGATNSYIRMPFVLTGALSGFLAATLALVLGFFLYGLVISKFSLSMKSLGLGDRLSFFSLTELAIILIVGSLVGALGSYLCIKNLNNGWSAAKA